MREYFGAECERDCENESDPEGDDRLAHGRYPGRPTDVTEDDLNPGTTGNTLAILFAEWKKKREGEIKMPRQARVPAVGARLAAVLAR
jgi:hypothetical protein